MKKLLELYRKIRERIAIKSSKQPVLMTLLVLVFVNFLIVVAATLITMSLDGAKYQNFFRTLLTVGKWLIFSASALSVENNSVMVVAICVAISGMILFTGTVIALTTNYLRNYISHKTEGSGKLPLNNHIVILNYNSQVLAVLTDLMHDGVDDTVIILSDKSRDFVRAEIAAELAELKDKPNSRISLIVRKGNPYSVAELSDINISAAKSILIMDDERSGQESNISDADYDAIKLVLKLSSFDISPECPIVVEAESYETAELIAEMKKSVKGLMGKSIEVFSYNRKLGQFLAISALYPSMTSVLYNLLSFSGAVFYPVTESPIEQYLHKYTGSIPILNLDKKTFVLAEDVKHLKQTREKPFNTTRKIKPLALKNEQKNIKLFVLGENKKSPYMIDAVKSMNNDVSIQTFRSNQRTEFIAALASAEGGAEENIAVILSEDTDKPENRDENIFLTLIEINRRFGTRNRPFKILAEILEPKNQENIEKFDIQNIIISSRIISFFVTKLITGAGVDRFYEEIFTHEIVNPDSKFSLCIEEAGKLFDFHAKLSFHSFAELVMAIYHGSDKAMMPLGVIRDGQTIYFCTDMDKKKTFTLKETDSFIYILYNNSGEN